METEPMSVFKKHQRAIARQDARMPKAIRDVLSPPQPKVKRRTFAQWKAAAQAHADDLGLLLDLWTEKDDYDLVKSAEMAFKRGDDPASFVEFEFDEDLARMQNDDEEYARSLEEE